MKVVLLLGWPAWTSLSPAMQEAGFRYIGLDWSYLPLDVPRGSLDAAFQAFKAECVVGANVTIPHKESVMSQMAVLTDRAKHAGAVNTIVKTRSGLAGDNTDGYGLLEALKCKGLSPNNRKAVVFGAGGAARGCIAGLVDSGISELVIVNRDPSKACSVLNSIFSAIGICPRARVVEWNDRLDRCLGEAISGASILLNTTPITNDGITSPVSDETMASARLASDCVVCDMVYRPSVTRFMRQGLDLGLAAVGGLDILLYQAVPGFQAWTGAEAPVEIMRSALYKAAGLCGGGEPSGKDSYAHCG